MQYNRSTEMGLSQKESCHNVGALGTGYDHGSPTSFEVGCQREVITPKHQYTRQLTCYHSELT